MKFPKGSKVKISRGAWTMNYSVTLKGDVAPIVTGMVPNGLGTSKAEASTAARQAAWSALEEMGLVTDGIDS